MGVVYRWRGNMKRTGGNIIFESKGKKHEEGTEFDVVDNMSQLLGVASREHVLKSEIITFSTTINAQFIVACMSMYVLVGVVANWFSFFFVLTIKIMSMGSYSLRSCLETVMSTTYVCLLIILVLLLLLYNLSMLIVVCWLRRLPPCLFCSNCLIIEIVNKKPELHRNRIIRRLMTTLCYVVVAFGLVFARDGNFCLSFYLLLKCLVLLPESFVGCFCTVLYLHEVV